jgi:hypothetical protein
MATQSLEFKSGLDDSKFQAGLNRMEKGAKASTGKISGMMKGFSLVGAARSAINAGQEVLNMGGNLDDQARSINMNVETMQKLQGVMMQGGVDQAKFVMGMTALGEAMVKARDEGGEAFKKFEKLGISFSQIDDAGEDTGKMFDIMSHAIKTHGSALDAATYAADILGGKQGKMIAVMAQGPDAIKEQAKAVEFLTARQVEYNARLGDSTDLTVQNLKTQGAAAATELADKLGTLGGMKDEVETPYLGPGAKRRENPDDVKKRLETEKEALEIRKESLEVVIKTAEEAYNAAKDATVAAKEVLKTVLSGEKLVKISSKDRNVKKMMDQMENPAPIAVGLKSGNLGPGLDALSSVKSSLKSGGIGAPTNFKDALKMRGPYKKPDAETRAAGKDDPKALSSRSGAAKAIKALEKTKELEKEKKDDLDKKKDQEKRMVTALEEINKGINGK